MAKEKIKNIIDSIIEIPIAMYYLLFRSTLSLVLFGLIIFSILIFGYIILTG